MPGGSSVRSLPLRLLKVTRNEIIIIIIIIIIIMIIIKLVRIGSISRPVSYHY